MSSSISLRSHLRLLNYAIPAAVLIGVIAAGQLMLANMGAPSDHWTFRHAFIMQTPCWVLWALLFPLVRALVERWPLERGSLRGNGARLLAAGSAIVAFHDGALIWFMHWIGHGYPKGHSFLLHLQESFRYRLWTDVVIYLGLVGVCVGWDYYRRYRERQIAASNLETQLARARLQALRMQLNPHFLFNALNSIAMLTRANQNATAVRGIAGLADLLRYVLEGSPADEVPLEQEIGFLKDYLQIEQLRFRERAEVVFDIDEEAARALIPNLLLQPLVENAVQHGIGRRLSAGRITIVARRLGDRLIVQVADTGPGIGGPMRTGVGLRNTRERLEQMYGAEQNLELRNGATGGCVATVSMPFRTAAALENAGVA